MVGILVSVSGWPIFRRYVSLEEDNASFKKQKSLPQCYFFNYGIISIGRISISAHLVVLLRVQVFVDAIAFMASHPIS